MNKSWSRRSNTRARPKTRTGKQGTSRQTRLGRSIAHAMPALARLHSVAGRHRASWRGGYDEVPPVASFRGPDGLDVFRPLLEFDGRPGPLELRLDLLGVFLG